MRGSFLMAIVLGLAAGPLRSASLTLGSPFGDGMVLQRARPVPVWGTAEANAAVEVRFAGQVKRTVASADGAWRVTLDPLEASKEARRLTVAAGTNEVAFSNVVVGEVWLCSGQSNMAMALADNTPHYGDDIGRMIAQVTDKPLVRYLTAPGRDGWHALTPEFLFAGRKAALAVHFALALHEQLDVPVGVVVAAVGGSNIDSWNPSAAAPADPNLHRSFIVGLAPYALRGALWYQGETNVREGGGYLPKLRQLDAAWRTLFEAPDLMFGYVQLAPFAYGKRDGVDLDEVFPVFLEAQAAFEREQPKAAMVVVNDIGNVREIHPGHKWLIARRLLLPALKRCYGRTDIEDHSPVPVRAAAVSNVVEVSFGHAKTLYVYDPDDPGSLSAPFELAGADGCWKPARVLNCERRDWMRRGNVGTNVLQLAADGVDRPARVRYAWRKPWKGVVHNQVNLPLGTFRLDVASAKAPPRLTDLSGPGWTADGEPVSVPHTWNAADGADGPGGERALENSSLDLKEGYARKAVVYRRALPDPTPGRRQFLRVEAASLVATVKVNGTAVGIHKGAFTAFCYEITKALKPSGNVLEIIVDNRRDPDVAPLTGDFTLQGGLYRKVWLVETPGVCIDRTVDGGPGVVLDVRPDGRVTARARVLGGADVTREFRFPNPTPWSPENPKLYEVTVALDSGDCVTVPFGFRTAELRADGFYLNGRKRVLRGVNRHQDVGARGWAADADDEARDVALIREIGANAVRTAHYPQGDGLYRRFDEAGILVWCEVPFVSRCTYSDAFEANLRDQYREMVAQLGHHPSIVFWSAWNEINPRKDARCVPLVKRFCDWARTVDPTRPMSAAGALVAGFTDLNATLAGTVAFNCYPGWYERDADYLPEKLDEIFRCNPGLTTTAVTEYGGGASVRQHGDPLVACRERGPHNEEYQAYLHSRVYRHLLADARLWGSFVWAMFDFASDARREGDREGINDKGLVTRDRATRKDAFYLYKANWTEEPVLHLVGGRMTEVASNRVNVVAFCNCGDVALDVNGARVGVQTPDEAKTAVFRDVPLAPGANDVRVSAGGLEGRATWTVRF